VAENGGVMGRELRMVPPDWEHPKKNGHYIPLYDGKDYREKAAKWIKDLIAWEKGTHPKSKETKIRYFWDWEGDPPKEDDYMLVDVPMSERTHFRLYESTSEGTPCGPVFASLDDLCAWAEKNATTFADFTATAAQWKEMLLNDFVHAVDPKNPHVVFL
jgi:hypothetical protein